MTKYKIVDEFLSELGSEQLTQVQTLRKYILDEVPSLTEHIKWNAPSYHIDGEDRITFNTINKQQAVKLVFHMGAIRKENKAGEPILKGTTLVEWVSDIRGYMTFNSLDEITSNEKEIKRIISAWTALN